MPSMTLSLTALLGIMSSFQGIVALPASSASSSSPESTTTLGEPVQATPTATIPLATTMNSTSTPGSESNDSVTQIYSRVITKEAWVEIYDNNGCGGKPIVKRINLGDQKCHNTPPDRTAKGMDVSWGNETFDHDDNFYHWDKPDCTGQRHRTWRNNPDWSPGHSCLPYWGIGSIQWTELGNRV